MKSFWYDVAMAVGFTFLAVVLGILAIINYQDGDYELCVLSLFGAIADIYCAGKAGWRLLYGE